MTDISQSQEKLFQQVSDLLVKLFDITPGAIKPDAQLYEDLDIDSIDAVDLVVELKKQTGIKIQPEAFKAVRTVQDVVEAVQRLIDG